MDFLLVNLKHKGSQSWIVSDETDLAIPNFNLASTEVTPLCLVTPQCCKNNNNHGISQHPQPIKNQSLAFWPPHCRGTSVNSHSSIALTRTCRSTRSAFEFSSSVDVVPGILARFGNHNEAIPSSIDLNSLPPVVDVVTRIRQARSAIITKPSLHPLTLNLSSVIYKPHWNVPPTSGHHPMTNRRLMNQWIAKVSLYDSSLLNNIFLYYTNCLLIVVLTSSVWQLRSWVVRFVMIFTLIWHLWNYHHSQNGYDRRPYDPLIVPDTAVTIYIHTQQSTGGKRCTVQLAVFPNLEVGIVSLNYCWLCSQLASGKHRFACQQTIKRHDNQS